MRVAMKQAGPLFGQKGGQTRHQRLAAHDRRGAHHPVVVAAQQVFGILKERLTVPAGRQNGDDGLDVDVNQGAAPGASLFQWLSQASARNHPQGGAKLAHPSTHRVDVAPAPAFLGGPDGLNPVGGVQPSCRGAQRHPFWLTFRGSDAEPAVALQAAADVLAPVHRRLPHAPTVIPAVTHNLGGRVRRRVEVRSRRHRQVHLAVAGEAFPVTDRFVAVQLRRQRPAPVQQEGEAAVN